MFQLARTALYFCSCVQLVLPLGSSWCHVRPQLHLLSVLQFPSSCTPSTGTTPWDDDRVRPLRTGIALLPATIAGKIMFVLKVDQAYFC